MGTIVVEVIVVSITVCVVVLLAEATKSKSTHVPGRRLAEHQDDTNFVIMSDAVLQTRDIFPHSSGDHKAKAN